MYKNIVIKKARYKKLLLKIIDLITFIAWESY